MFQLGLQVRNLSLKKEKDSFNVSVPYSWTVLLIAVLPIDGGGRCFFSDDKKEAKETILGVISD